MNNKFKKIAASVMAVMTLAVGMTGMTANAATFSFDLGRGGSAYDSATKGNYKSFASVNVTSGNLSSSAFMNFRLKNSSGSSAMSTTKKRTATGSFTLTYTTVTPTSGTTVRLQGNAGYYGGEAAGSWAP